MRLAMQRPATYVLAVVFIFVAVVLAGSAAAHIGAAAGSTVIVHPTPDPHP